MASAAAAASGVSGGGVNILKPRVAWRAALNAARGNRQRHGGGGGAKTKYGKRSA